MRQRASSSQFKFASHVDSFFTMRNHQSGPKDMNRPLPEAGRDDSGRSLVDEDALLRSALQDSGGLLTSSLREEERRRRTRQMFVITLIGGGIVMGTVAIAAFAGWL